jgi:hypothetical protein
VRSREYTTGVSGRTPSWSSQLSAADDLAERLLELDRILSRERAASFSGEGDPVSLHLSAVPAERIRELTSLLGRTAGSENDELDAVTMRLLLNDYTSAVGHLRAVARSAATRIDDAAMPVREAQLFMKRDVRREERLELKRERQSQGEREAPPV